MYLIIKNDESEHLKSKLHKAKKLICEIAEYFEEATEEARESESFGHDMTRKRSSFRDDDYDDDDYRGRDMTRGRGTSMRRGRY